MENGEKEEHAQNFSAVFRMYFQPRNDKTHSLSNLGSCYLTAEKAQAQALGFNLWQIKGLMP